jgi:hypothetical protein
MKRVGLWMIGIGLFITVGLLTVELGYAEPTCTLNTLKGTYQFAATGYNLPSTGPRPIAIAEVIDVNGDGTLNVPAVTLSFDGSILRSVDMSNFPVGGSYTVNEDCTGTMTHALVPFVTGVHFDIFIAPDGKKFDLIQTDEGNVLAAVAKKVSPK